MTFGNSAYGGPAVPATSALEPPNTKSAGFRVGRQIAVRFLLIIWLIHVINVVVFRGGLAYFGIQPLDVPTILHIFSAPLIHGSWQHIIANSTGAIFAFLVGYSGRRVFWEVTLISMVVGGLGTWLTGGQGIHVGASGVIYGWLGYLVIRGIFNRSWTQILLGIVLSISFSSMVWGVFPTAGANISWQGHMWGAIGGILAGAFITSDDPPKLRAKRQQQRLERK
ncbi:rhomboid family intramembrane serine protease [Corynebacterium sp. HS2168-gen11]|uniref:rhomboid family intramembrane serine protease n=1 Tax=Corynebacterium sp. HS2168-gen11 TaxID=2974027 RepID=UPI00216ACB5A|nr:rhomboid family intramembrane serine protease [Corynebacterium sp. HS2168-gen11]MCS4535285.1 rhomboid family intramembrane serine protease [Corynebacterium sp. HS2168-gen11]